MSSETSNKKFKRMSESERIADYDHATQKILEEMDVIQTQLDSIKEKASEEVLQIDIKYNRIRKPHLDKRSQLISNIPNFWATAIMNHPDISNLFSGQEEEDCLHHLTKIEIEDFDDILSGFIIKFYFDENPYFENPVLTKEYVLGNDSPSSKSTPINWKEGVQLGQVSQEVNKTNRKRRLESTRTSFFTWFTDNVDPLADGQEEENGVEGEEETSSDENEDPGEPDNQSGSSGQGNSSRPV
ncbi:hypothetical protein HUJ04_012459 [Dendroctonus ponderosae]|nr:hypothetical protein HUJ04_012459 [Dendroctonus ponderosae]KAH1023212.1 hypothetical protein HUJ04_012459 [Dendroctonus ponderosae]KAH1023213.1 hypothetical protein HUJ04_012459 [Dendroctonus ponderosae]KAH1029657.1 hypothetical protein HUJ05_002852 [Dendroctonus ponderosae]KAH1029658.1 hypothetical protein HUJ05_002852 [Dendroctonus ponderosae]